MSEPAQFIKVYVTDLGAVLGKLKSNAKLTEIQSNWLGMCLTGILLTNSLCWAKFQRACLGAYKIAAFSFDGVIGAFAITQDVIIIMLGLAIGAMFVRSLTVYLVRQGTLDEYVFLEHGAHYAIGVLAGLMLISMRIHVPEIITGLTGAILIGLSVFSSIRYKKATE
nr:DUF475 domain-containing protein [Crenothrix polyspora]